MSKRIILSGLLAGVIILVISLALNFIFGLIFPGMQAEYQSGVFRPWSDPLMMLIFIYPFVLSFILAWAWDRSKSLFKGKGAWTRGAKFGLAVWFISSIPGMFVTYSSFTVSFPMILSWSIAGLIEVIVAGAVFAKMNK